MKFQEFVTEERQSPEQGKVWVKSKKSGDIYQVTKDYYNHNRRLYDTPDKKEIEKSQKQVKEPAKNKEFDRVSSQKWFSELESKGKVYFVGGAVRDEFIGKKSKDVDILVQGLSLNQIAILLQKHGKPVMNEVGGKQAVIKFVPNGEKEEVDIAIPRSEVKSGKGHKGFDIKVDPNMSIEEDLKRRDFTINAIAKDKEGNIIDPFNGQDDLKKKIIRIVNPQAFSDDPLRMLRAVQFSSRFNFTIEPKTLNMIREKANTIKEISGERIKIEFDKIVKKGDPAIGANMLRRTGLFKALFGYDGPGPDSNQFKKVKTMGEFFFLLTTGEDLIADDMSDLWMKKFQGDKESAKEISALQKGGFVSKQRNENRYKVFQMHRLSPKVLQTKILSSEMLEVMNEFNSGKYPKSLKELAINGKDLGELGLQGKEIGTALNKSIKAIYNDEIKNDKSELIKYIQTKN